VSFTPIPFLDLSTPHRALEPQLVDVLREALHSAAFIGGAHVDAFEGEFAAYCGTAHCVGVGSGTDALRLALMACGVGPGDAVVTVSHTFIATVEAISQAGAAAEFVDIDEHSYTMSPGALSVYLARCPIDPETSRPLGLRSRRPIRAIVPVHLYGQVADMSEILSVARRYGLVVVEDACQAHGARRLVDGAWRPAGSMGMAAAFSFYPGKNLGACGEGGAITTDDPAVARTARMLRDHGQAQKYYHALEGYNARLDAIQAGFLRVKLPHLDGWNDARRTAAARYNELLSTTPDVRTPTEPDSSRGVYHLYVIRTAKRDRLAEMLKQAGIATGFHYPVPVHLQACYRDWGYRPGSLPVTERAAQEVLSLPMFPGLTAEQQARVAMQLSSSLQSMAAPVASSGLPVPLSAQA
jgi:dTDP-4-amino-4,6-dideoxygalactose transaminase